MLKTPIETFSTDYGKKHQYFLKDIYKQDR